MSGPISRATTPQGYPRGFFISLEGIEGSGKSTHAQFLAETLEQRGLSVLATREPGGTPLAEALRALTLGTEGETPVPEAELLMIVAARAQHLQKLILPALAEGRVVICDRFGDASLAYQGGGRGLGVDRVAAVNAFATSGIRPDLTLLLDVSVEEGLRRVEHRSRRTGTLDRLDQESARFFTAVRDTYLSLAEAEPDRFVVVDPFPPKPELAASILAIVEPRLAERQQRGALR